jgi:hypothetical protein
VTTKPSNAATMRRTGASARPVREAVSACRFEGACVVTERASASRSRA